MLFSHPVKFFPFHSLLSEVETFGWESLRELLGWHAKGRLWGAVSGTPLLCMGSGSWGTLGSVQCPVLMLQWSSIPPETVNVTSTFSCAEVAISALYYQKEKIQYNQPHLTKLAFFIAEDFIKELLKHPAFLCCMNVYRPFLTFTSKYESMYL